MDAAEVAAPGSRRLRSPRRGRGDRTDPGEEVLGKRPWRQSQAGLFCSGWDFLVLICF